MTFVKHVRKNSMWVKDEIKTMMTQWETKTKEQLADELGKSPQQITYMAMSIRKAGFPLSKKHKTGVVRNLINECISEINGRRRQ